MNKYTVTIDGSRHEVELPAALDGKLRSGMSTVQDYLTIHTVLVDGLPVSVIIPELRDTVEAVQCLILDDRPMETSIDPNMRWIKSPWGMHSLEIRELKPSVSSHRAEDGINGLAGNGRIKAPIPGLIIQVRVSPGESVEAGQSLFILEAMKMENEIRAPRSGIIKSVNISPGQVVSLNQVLAEIE